MKLTILNIFLESSQSAQVKAVGMAIVFGLFLFIKSLFSKKDK
jgi:hypothetical protein